MCLYTQLLQESHDSLFGGHLLCLMGQGIAPRLCEPIETMHWKTPVRETSKQSSKLFISRNNYCEWEFPCTIHSENCINFSKRRLSTKTMESSCCCIRHVFTSRSRRVEPDIWKAVAITEDLSTMLHESLTNREIKLMHLQP